MATNKLLWSSKLIGVFFIMLVCTLSANAQFLRTSYFMEGTQAQFENLGELVKNTIFVA